MAESIYAFCWYTTVTLFRSALTSFMQRGDFPSNIIMGFRIVPVADAVNTIDFLLLSAPIPQILTCFAPFYATV